MCGIAAFITMRSAYTALVDAQASYYRRYRFADVFAHATRAPEAVAARIRELPGVATVQTRIVAEVVLDVPGLARAGHGAPRLDPGPARADPQRPAPAQRALGRAGRPRRGDRQRGVRRGQRSRDRLTDRRGHQRPLAAPDRGRHRALPGVHLRDPRRRGLPRQPPLRRALDGARGAGGALRPEGGVQRRLGRPRPRRAGGPGDRRHRPRCSVATAASAPTAATCSSRTASSPTRSSRTASRGSTCPSIFLGVAVFLVHVVLSRLVGSQRDQIAILKAFGYTNTAVGLHYLGIAHGRRAGGGGARHPARPLVRLVPGRPLRAVLPLPRDPVRRLAGADLVRGGDQRRGGPLRRDRGGPARRADAAGRGDAPRVAAALLPRDPRAHRAGPPAAAAGADDRAQPRAPPGEGAALDVRHRARGGDPRADALLRRRRRLDGADPVPRDPARGRDGDPGPAALRRGAARPGPPARRARRRAVPRRVGAAGRRPPLAPGRDHGRRAGRGAAAAGHAHARPRRGPPRRPRDDRGARPATRHRARRPGDRRGARRPAPRAPRGSPRPSRTSSV